MNVLVLSATASAINYQKALAGRRDVRLFMTDASPFASGLYGENVIPLIVPRARDLDRYRAALENILRDHSIDLLIPTSDHDMEGVMELLHRGWDPPVKMFRPSYEVYRTLTHKGLLIEAMRAKGLRCPAVYTDLADVKFPVVVKPAREGGSKGIWIVDNEQELRDRLETVRTAYRGDVILQEFIPGGVGSIYVALLLYGPDGRCYGEVASHSHLTFMTWGGGGNAGTVVDEPDLLRQARDIMERLGGWAGPVNLEFKRHQDTGRFYLMEVNCRLNGYSYLYTMNGLNFPSAVVDLLQHGRIEYLCLNGEQPRRNFVVGFRERVVEDWAHEAA
jgi:carbamoylphosphate synthase large subunit